MGAGASTDAEKVAMYDQLSQKYPELVKSGAVNDAQVQEVLKEAQPKKRLSNSQPTKRRSSASAASIAQIYNGPVNLEEVFTNFCAMQRADGMTNTVFAKFCNDAKIISKNFPKPQIDMVWTKCAGKEKKVAYPVFLRMCDEIAKVKGMTMDTLADHIAKNGPGPVNTGTKGESRFYDDKNTWTGVATKGGPTSLDKRSSLEDLADRDNKADVRGVIQP